MLKLEITKLPNYQIKIIPLVDVSIGNWNRCYISIQYVNDVP